MVERDGARFTVQQRREAQAKAWELHRRGVSQQRIADELDVTQGTVSHWLKAWMARNKQPSPYELAAAAIRAELVCCDIYERLSRLPANGEQWKRIRASTDYHDICFFGEWAARIVEKTEGQ